MNVAKFRRSPDVAVHRPGSSLECDDQGRVLLSVAEHVARMSAATCGFLAQEAVPDIAALIRATLALGASGTGRRTSRPPTSNQREKEDD